jgi:ribonuclease HI
MDDVLLLFRDRETAEVQTREIAAYLQELGWTLATEKCEMTPTQRIEFLGWEWDLQAASVRMTQTRRTDLRTQLETWRQRAVQRMRVPVRELAKLIGNINFLRVQIPETSLYTKEMDKLKIQAVAAGGWNGYCTANPSLLGEILWWNKRITANRPQPLTEWPTVATMTTDASPAGWGAILHTQADEQPDLTFGFCNEEQKGWTSNAKELWAVWKGLKYFGKDRRLLPRTTVLIRSDNSTVVGELNRQSATASLARQLRRLLTLAARWQIRLTAAHIPGVQNTTADRLSRMGREREYYLKEEYLTRVKKELAIQPDMDPFAASPYIRSETATGHPKEAFAQNWTGHRVFLHPPPHMITRVLSKMRQEKTQGILIAPTWKSQPWSPSLSQLSLRSINLGPYEEVMELTPRFRREGWTLPPGNVMAALLDTRTTEGSSY